MEEAGYLELRAQMFEFFKNGVIGTKEFRNWLAKQDNAFAEIRDSSVDDEIDSLARQRRAMLDRERGSEPEAT